MHRRVPKVNAGISNFSPIFIQVMKIQKPVALFFLIVNALYVVICVIRFFYTKAQLIIDYSTSHTKQLAADSAWKIIPEILFGLVFIGLIWVLNTFHEKLWTKLGVALFLLSKISIMIIIPRIQHYIYVYRNILIMFDLAIFFTFIYLVVGLLLVRNKTIKQYCRWFTIGFIVSLLISVFGRVLYDDYGIRWALINEEAVSELCFTITLALFIRVFALSIKQDEEGVEGAVSSTPI